MSVVGGTVRRGALGTLAARLLGFTGIFAVGSGFGLLLAMVRLAVLTRLLDISVYGQLTLLVITATFVAMAVRMGIITGTLRSVFQGADGEDGEGEEAAESEDLPGAAVEQQRILGTGLIVSILMTAALMGAVAAFAGPIDRMLIDSGSRFAIVAAIALGGLDASYRLVSHIPRFERRPVTFVSLQLVHAVLGLAAAIVLIELGYGLDGAIWGLVVGTVLAFIPGLWMTRHRFSPAIDLGYVVVLAKIGAPFAAITGGFWLFRNADIFVVSRYLPEADVALYRVAGRIGGMTSALIGGVILAWGPLMRGPLRGTLHREGLLEVAGARLLTYYWLIAVWLIVALLLTRDLLIKIAPPEYAYASTLIVLLGAAALAIVGLLLVYRTSRMKAKRLALGVLLMTMSPALVGLSILLVPRFGLEGAAIASIVVPSASAAVYLVISQRTSDKPLDLPWRRLVAATASGVAYGGVLLAVMSAVGPAVPFSIVAALVFPVVLVLVGALPRDEMKSFAKMVSPRLRRDAPKFDSELVRLEGRDLELLELLLRDRRRPKEVARRFGQSPEELLQRFVAVLRDLGDVGEPQPADDVIGRYLLSPLNVNLRDREGQLLTIDQEAYSLEVDQLTGLSDRISRLSQRRWLAIRNGA